MVTEQRQPILTDVPILRAQRDAIIYVRERYAFDTDAWVLLPDHLHTIWTLPEGDADYVTRWRLIKTHVTKACDQRYAHPTFFTAWHTAKKCGTSRWVIVCCLIRDLFYSLSEQLQSFGQEKLDNKNA